MFGVDGNILTPSLLSNLTAIKRTQRALDVTTLRLATGLKVNSALDNPQNFFTAQSLSNRASDLARIQDGINQSIRTVEEAIHGTEALERLLNQAEAIGNETREELQSGVATADLTFIGEEIVDISPVPLSSQIIADNPVAYYRLNGDATEQTGNPLTFDGNPTGGTSFAGPALYNNGAGTSADFDGVNDRIRVPDSTLINTSNYNARTIELVFNADDTISRQVLFEEGATVNGLTIYIDNGALRVTGEDDSGANRFADIDITSIEEFGALNVGETYHAALVFDSDNNAFTGYLNGVNIGSVFVTDENFPSHSGDIGIGAVNGGVQFHDGESNVGNGFNFDGRISDVAIYNRALLATEIESHANSLNSATTTRYINTEFETVLQQIDEIVEDANYRGINLLENDDLVTDFNEDRSNNLLTEGVDFTFNGLGIERYDFNDINDLDEILTSVREAREQVRRFGRSLASDLSIIETRDRFTQETINNLRAGADDLTVADQNEEGANLLALQVRQQLQVSVLGASQLSIADFLL